MKKLLFMFMFVFVLFMGGCSDKSPIDYAYAYEIVDTYAEYWQEGYYKSSNCNSSIRQVEYTQEPQIDLLNRGLVFAADGFDFELISEPRFDWVSPGAYWSHTQAGLFRVGIGSSIYVIDRQGEIVDPHPHGPPLPNPSPFHTRENLISRYAIYGYSRAQCSISLLWGISDKEHSWVVNPLFLQLENLYGGNLMV